MICTVLITLFALVHSELPAPTSEVSRVINGFTAEITQIPYVASIRRRVTAGWSHSCGGVIIHSNAVLTAAHCLSNYESQPTYLRVVVGTSNRLTGGTAYAVKKVIVHEVYSTTILNNDIGMLVTNDIQFDEKVAPIAFAAAGLDIPDETEALVSGFGVTETGTTSQVLRAAHVYIVSQYECLRAYLQISTITSQMICASASNPARDACQGDSGGPLVTNGTLIGLVSFGEGCADKTYPGVYTRVSEYDSWIRQKLTCL